MCWWNCGDHFNFLMRLSPRGITYFKQLVVELVIRRRLLDVAKQIVTEDATTVCLRCLGEHHCEEEPIGISIPYLDLLQLVPLKSYPDPSIGGVRWIVSI